MIAASMQHSQTKNGGKVSLTFEQSAWKYDYDSDHALSKFTGGKSLINSNFTS
jgi:hypothetical protein